VNICNVMVKSAQLVLLIDLQSGNEKIVEKFSKLELQSLF
jgi:hypothetical protein